MMPSTDQPDERPPTTWPRLQRNYWDHVASIYPGLYQDPWHKAEEAEIGALLSQIVEVPTLVVDLGCGQGLGLALIRRFVGTGPLYVGVDLSIGMLLCGRKRVDDRAHLVQADMHSTPLADGSAQTVISLFSSMSYLENPGGAIVETARLIAPGGTFLLMCLSRRSLRRLLGLKLGSIEHYGTSELSRHSSADSAPVRLLTRRELCGLLTSSGLNVAEIVGQSVLRPRRGEPGWRWSVSRFVGRRIPDLGNSLIAWGRKPK